MYSRAKKYAGVKFGTRNARTRLDIGRSREKKQPAREQLAKKLSPLLRQQL